MRSNSYNPRTVSRIRSVLTRFAKKIDTPAWPAHPTRAIGEASLTADILFKPVKD